MVMNDQSLWLQRVEEIENFKAMSLSEKVPKKNNLACGLGPHK